MHRHPRFVALLGLAAVLTSASSALADTKTQAAREAAEYVLSRFGRTAVRESAETLAGRIAAGAAKYGDHMIPAVRQMGPRALQLVEQAAAHNPRLGPQAARLLATEGEHAATWVLSRPTALGQFGRYGENAAAALIRHKGIAEPMIERAGASAIAALKAVTPQSGRRLAILAEEGGELAKISQSPEVLNAIAKYGDPACDFLWRNKGALAVTAVGATFLVNPEPYLNGTKELAGMVASNAVKPIAEVPAIVAKEAARSINWTLVVIVGMSILTLLAAVRWRLFRPGAPTAAAPGAPTVIHLQPTPPAASAASTPHTGGHP